MRIDNPSMPHANHGLISFFEDPTIFTVVDDEPRIKISQSDITGATNVDFVLPAGFHFFELFIRNLVPVTGGTDLGLQVSLDSGATFKAGASDYAYALWGGDTTTGFVNQIDAANTFILLNQTTNGLGTTGTQAYNARVFIFNPFGGRMFPMIMCHSSNNGSTGLQTAATSAGAYVGGGNASVSGVRFLLNSGNFERGEIYLYGIR